MKSEFEIASMISNDVTSAQGVTDFPVSLKQISDNIDTLRVRVIDDLDSKGLMKKPFFNFTQTIITTTLKTASNQRYVDIPKLISFQNSAPAIAYIGGSGDTPKSFRIVYGTHNEFHTADRWIGKLPTAIVTDSQNGNRIFFKNISPNTVRIVAIFGDPSDLEPFGYNGSIKVVDGASVYPMPSGQLDILMGKITESYLRDLYRLPVQANQAVDSPQVQKNQPGQ